MVTINEQRLEELGRKRPEKFGSFAVELGFCFSIMTSQITAEFFISGFNVIVPYLTADLEFPPNAFIWPASAFALTAGGSLLIFGRLADKYGGYVVYTCGLLWQLIWTIVAGFAQNKLMIIFARALQGFGPAAYLSAGLMLLGSSYRPGPRKNLIFSIYGGCAPIGFFMGIFMSSIAAQYLTWRWYFYLGAILNALSLATGWWFIESDFKSFRADPAARKRSSDWPGAALLFSGLVLLFFAVNDGAHAPRGWATPYIYVTCIVGCLVLGGAAYIEGYVSEDPLLPFSLFKVAHMPAFIVALFFSYGVLGSWLLYTTFYTTAIMGAKPLQLVAWFVPFIIGGLILSPLGGMLLHRIPGKILLIISGVAWVLAPLIFAIAPEGASYWRYTFPAMICGTLGIDITYNIANIFVTTRLPEEHQGLAGAVCNSALFLGISFFLGFADLTASQVADQGPRKSYKAAFWFQVAVAAAALILMTLFVDIGVAKSELREGESLESESSEDPEKA